MAVTGAQVAVLGSGLTGTTVALALARAGKRVVLLEQDPVAINRASVRNEGKIHLGLVYAADPSLATAKLMLEGALSFRRSIVGLLAGRTDALATSTPFTYLVAKGSLLAPAQLADRYSAIEALYRTRLREDAGLDYMGRRPKRLARPVKLADLDPRFRVDSLEGAFVTEELAIDTDRLGRALRKALREQPMIRVLTGHRIRSVRRAAGGFDIRGDGDNRGTWRLAAEQVVNCLWESRRRIDAQVGVDSMPGWVYRLKYRVIARLPRALRDGPSATMVVGRFGDVVVRSNGHAYFSWYPASLRGWSAARVPPGSWDAPCRGEIGRAEARIIASEILAGIDAWYPGAAGATPIQVDAGVIVAYGDTDVDDPASGLHVRTRVGVFSVDGYHAVDPGKLTTAPYFGMRAARAVLGLADVP